ncbi:MAG: DUF2752 domain-containing protein [Pirellulales bacterium]
MSGASSDTPYEVAEIVEEKDPRIAQLRERHWTVLIVSTAIVIAAVCLEVGTDEHVAVKGWPGFPLPNLCMSRAWFGIECPGCGLTRSFIHLAHGRLSESIAMHRVGWILAIVVVLQVPYRINALRQSPPGGLDRHWPNWLAIALITLLIGNWCVSLLIHFMGW